MEEKVIDLQDLFVMNSEYFVKFLKERCFDTLNAFLKEKSGVAHDPLFVRQKGGKIEIGYVPQDRTVTNFFSNEAFSEAADTLTKVCTVQFVIFEGCKAYGCYEDVPMAGAPEEEKNAFFRFTYENVKYTFKLWTKR